MSLKLFMLDPSCWTEILSGLLEQTACISMHLYLIVDTGWYNLIFFCFWLISDQYFIDIRSKHPYLLLISISLTDRNWRLIPKERTLITPILLCEILGTTSKPVVEEKCALLGRCGTIRSLVLHVKCKNWNSILNFTVDFTMDRGSSICSFA